ncbi:hypothetical protein D3C87_17950 [compost metagenome]
MIAVISGSISVRYSPQKKNAKAAVSWMLRLFHFALDKNLDKNFSEGFYFSALWCIKCHLISLNFGFD